MLENTGSLHPSLSLSRHRAVSLERSLVNTENANGQTGTTDEGCPQCEFGCRIQTQAKNDHN